MKKMGEQNLEQEVSELYPAEKLFRSFNGIYKLMKDKQVINATSWIKVVLLYLNPYFFINIKLLCIKNFL